ncbi:MAG: YIP1 family protein [Candidatus Syntrophoarchaeum sp.]|nr:YIP1 family protein [Candidatus Syntrophoarchaeum sp.]
MTDLLENIFGTLFSPASTFRRMLEERTTVTIAAIIVLIAGICSGEGSILMQNALMSLFAEFPGFEVVQLSPAASIILSVVSGFIGWVVIAGILHVVAKILGGKGVFTEMLVLMGFAALPNVFQAPIGLVVILSGGLTGAFIALGLSGILAIWILILDVLAIREAHKFSTGRAIATLVLPFVVLIVLVFMLMIGIFLTLG